MVSNSYEIARIRNSLIADIGQADDFSWAPTNIPPDFLLEKAPIPVEFKQLVERLDKSYSESDSWGKSLQISQHLEQGPGRGDGIKSSTLNTYKTMMTSKAGYCSDYTQVFNGIAYSADIPVREWGMSFDGYSGRGHAFNEIYDHRIGKWIFVDSFNSFYVLDKKTNIALSAIEFSEKLKQNKTDEITITPITPERFGFRDTNHAIEYYRRGADQFFLWFGNNVLSYDNHFAIRTLGSTSRAIEQIIGITLGIFPRIKLIPSDTNKDQINLLFSKRNTFLLLLSTEILLGIGLLLQIFMYRASANKPRSLS